MTICVSLGARHESADRRTTESDTEQPGLLSDHRAADAQARALGVFALAEKAGQNHQSATATNQPSGLTRQSDAGARDCAATPSTHRHPRHADPHA